MWLRDGLGVVFMADRGGPPHLFRKNLQSRAPRTHCCQSDDTNKPADVSPDGKTLAFEQRTPLGNYDIIDAFP